MIAYFISFAIYAKTHVLPDWERKRSSGLPDGYPRITKGPIISDEYQLLTQSRS